MNLATGNKNRPGWIFKEFDSSHRMFLEFILGGEQCDLGRRVLGLNADSTTHCQYLGSYSTSLES